MLLAQLLCGEHPHGRKPKLNPFDIRSGQKTLCLSSLFLTAPARPFCFRPQRSQDRAPRPTKDSGCPSVCPRAAARLRLRCSFPQSSSVATSKRSNGRWWLATTLCSRLETSASRIREKDDAGRYTELAFSPISKNVRAVKAAAAGFDSSWVGHGPHLG